MLVDKLVCEAGPSRKETYVDFFEPCCLRGAEAGSMEVPENLSLVRSVVDAVRGMAVGLLFRAKILEFVDREVLTGAW